MLGCSCKRMVFLIVGIVWNSGKQFINKSYVKTSTMIWKFFILPHCGKEACEEYFSEQFSKTLPRLSVRAVEFREIYPWEGHRSYLQLKGALVGGVV